MESVELSDNNQRRISRQRTIASSSNNEPTIDYTLPTEEWFDEMYGPGNLSTENIHEASTHQNQSNNPRKMVKNRQRKANSNQANLNQEVIELSDNDEDISIQDHDLKPINSMNKRTNEAANVGGDAAADGNPNEGSTDILKIILTQNKLKLLTQCSTAKFHRAAIGCFVRLKLPYLTEKFKEIIFIDQIVEVLEPQSYQHFWFNRRFRLRNFGDFELHQIFDGPAESKDLRTWLSYLKAKGKSLPTEEFIKKKKADLLECKHDLKAKAGSLDDKDTGKVMIKRDDLGKIVLSTDVLRDLSKLDFDRFKKVVTGCFICVMAIRKDKSDNCQYHIVRVLDCIHGSRQYKVRNLAKVDYELVLNIYGNYIITWLDSDFTTVTEEGFQQWIEDMKEWKEPIPTLEEIREKAADLQLALTEAKRTPSIAELEKKRKEEEESARRAKMPIQEARDLEKCLLNKPQLQKITSNWDWKNDMDALLNILMGCFVRVKLDAGKSYQIDQIRDAEFIEQKAEQIEEMGKAKPVERISILLKFAGATTLVSVMNNSSTFKITEQEFKDWLRKVHAQLDQPLPTYGFVEKKHAEIGKAMEIVAEQVEKRAKEKDDDTVNKKKTSTDQENRRTDFTRKKPTNESHRDRERRPYNRREQNHWAADAKQPSQTRYRQPVRETPGLRPGWMMNSSAPTLFQNQRQQSYDDGQGTSASATQQRLRDENWTYKQTAPIIQRRTSPPPPSLVHQLIADPNHINFVRGRENSWLNPAGATTSLSSVQMIETGGNAPVSFSSSATTIGDRYMRQQPYNDRPYFSSQLAQFSSSSSSSNLQSDYLQQPTAGASVSRFDFNPISNREVYQRISDIFANPESPIRQPSQYNHLHTALYGTTSDSHYNTAQQGAPKRRRQLSPQAPPVHRLF